MPLLKQYQLQLVDVVLKTHGIGVFPTKKLITALVSVGLVWMLWSYITAQAPQPPPPPQQALSPYATYNQMLASPAPDEEIKGMLAKLNLLFSLPGWTVKAIDYSNGTLLANVTSGGTKAETLLAWAHAVGATFGVKNTGFVVIFNVPLTNRPVPTNIYPIRNIIAILIDRLSNVIPGNNMQLGEFKNQDVFNNATLTIAATAVTPVVLAMIGEQLKDLPLVLKHVTMSNTNGTLSGSIEIEVLGN